jgi:hypothetical protein
MSIVGSYGPSDSIHEEDSNQEKVTNKKRKSPQDHDISHLSLSLKEFDSWPIEGGIQRLAKKCKHLQSLDVRVSSSFLSSNNINFILKESPLIRKLLASHSNLDFAGLNALSTKSMECLHVRGCYNISPSNLIDFLSRAPNIKELRLVKDLATPEVAEAIAKYCPLLEVLEFSEIVNPPEASYLIIAKNCPCLKELSVYNSQTFSDDVFKEFLYNCPELTKVKARYTKVTDASLELINKLQRKMQMLDVSQCEITNDGLEKLLKVSKDSLEQLEINGMRIDKKTVDLLCKYSPPLRLCNFSGISLYGVSPLGSDLLALLKKFPLLEEIYIPSFDDVDTKVLLEILNLCPNVKIIFAAMGQLDVFAASYALDERSFRKKFLEEHGVNVCRLAY